jgi:hypothetical protein
MFRFFIAFKYNQSTSYQINLILINVALELEYALEMKLLNFQVKEKCKTKLLLSYDHVILYALKHRYLFIEL